MGAILSYVPIHFIGIHPSKCMLTWVKAGSEKNMGENASRKHCRKKRKCFTKAFSYFPTMFSKIVGSTYSVVCTCLQFGKVLNLVNCM